MGVRSVRYKGLRGHWRWEGGIPTHSRLALGRNNQHYEAESVGEDVVPRQWARGQARAPEHLPPLHAWALAGYTPPCTAYPSLLPVYASLATRTPGLVLIHFPVLLLWLPAVKELLLGAHHDRFCLSR
jgi:hypothetical protein